jgi:hypothetical protein
MPLQLPAELGIAAAARDMHNATRGPPTVCSGFSTPLSPGDQWRINFSRVQWKVRWDAALSEYVKVRVHVHGRPTLLLPVLWHRAASLSSTVGAMLLAALPAGACGSSRAELGVGSPVCSGHAPAGDVGLRAVCRCPGCVRCPGCRPGGRWGCTAAGAQIHGVHLECHSCAHHGTPPAAAGGCMGAALTRTRPRCAAVQQAASKPVQYTPDPSWPLRTFLMDVYYAQTEHWQSNGCFCDSLRALGVKAPAEAINVKLQTTDVSCTHAAWGGTCWMQLWGCRHAWATSRSAAAAGRGRRRAHPLTGSEGAAVP